MNEPIIVSVQTVQSWLFRDGIDVENADRLLAAERYVLPQREWVLKTCAKYWNTIRTAFYPAGYKIGKSVCFDFAIGAMWAAGRCHAKTATKTDGARLMFGVIGYKRQPTDIERHGINFAYYWENDTGIFLPFEPQTSKEEPLSPVQRNSCSFVMF